jgi:Dolichyl-phosphate-mannose-protein mannosyltransferase
VSRADDFGADATPAPRDVGANDDGRHPALERAWDALGSRSVALPVLAAMTLCAVGARIWLGRKIVTPWIMIDELVYSEFAKSFVTTGHYFLRGQPVVTWSYLYPGVISPAWWANSMSMTYGVAKAINAVVMTLAVIPVYVWASRLASRRYALVAAALLLLIPSYYYTAMLMTENVFLPTFVLASLAVALALERPTILRQLLALGAIGLVIAARFQGVVFVLIYATAVLLKVALDLRVERNQNWRRALSSLARYWPSDALVVLAAVAYVVWKRAHGLPLSTGVGTYQAVFTGGYSFSSVARWTLYHFAELPLAVAVIPASAFLLLLGIAVVRGTADERERAFLAVTAAAAFWVVIEISAYASRFSLRVEERYMFGLAPLLLIAFVVWLDRGLPRPGLLTAIAALVPALLFLTLPLGRLLNISILSDTFGLIPFLRLSEKLHGVSHARTFLILGGAAAALAFAFVPRRFAAVLPVAMGVFLVLSSYSVHGAIRDYARGLRRSSGLGTDPSWIDAAVGDHRAAFLFRGDAETGPESSFLWQVEFWNRSIKDFYDLDGAEPVPLGGTTLLATQPATGRLVETSAAPFSSDRYVVTESDLQLDGRKIATHGPLTLYRTKPPLGVSSVVQGVYGDGWTGPDASFTRFVPSPRGSKLVVTLSRADWGGPDVPGHVRVEVHPVGTAAPAATVRTWVAHSRTAQTFRLPAPTGPFRVTIHVDPTFSPSNYGLPDSRQLGVEARFAVVPPPAPQ